jgi:hypothetical protein
MPNRIDVARVETDQALRKILPFEIVFEHLVCSTYDQSSTTSSVGRLADPRNAFVGIDLNK